MCVLSRFLPQYTERFPNVHVELSEALGAEQKTLLERGEVHFGIRLEQGGPRFDSRVLPPADALAAGATSIERGQAGLIDIGGLASYPLLLLDPGYSIRRLVDAACRLADVEPNILLESLCTAQPACCGGGWVRCGNRPIPPANRPLKFANCPGNPSSQTHSRASCNSMGNASPSTRLR
jgi:DNA-binding transcriptional LysR family regulator